ncbi:MAG: hypothetical protein ABEI57_01800, partial [Halapricum sp.]
MIFEYSICPDCETAVLGIVTRGPGDHRFDPCGCRVTTQTARDLAGGSDRGRGLAADGGHEPWCDWCQRAFGSDGPEWKIETDA